MPRVPQVDINGTPEKTQGDAEAAKVMRGKVFLETLSAYAQKEEVKGVKTGISMSSDSLKLLNVVKLNPKNAAIVITAVTVKKAMRAAGLGTKEETMECIISVAKLGSSLGIAVATMPTLGVSYVALGFAAIEAYDVRNSCFKIEKGVTFAVKPEGT